MCFHDVETINRGQTRNSLKTSSDTLRQMEGKAACDCDLWEKNQRFDLIEKLRFQARDSRIKARYTRLKAGRPAS